MNRIQLISRETDVFSQLFSIFLMSTGNIGRFDFRKLVCCEIPEKVLKARCQITKKYFTNTTNELPFFTGRRSRLHMHY